MNVDPEALSATASTSMMILGCPIVWECWASAYLHQHHGRRRAKSWRLHFGERCHGTVSHSHQLRAQRCTQQHPGCAPQARLSATTSGRRARALPNVGYTESEQNVNILSHLLTQLAPSPPPRNPRKAKFGVAGPTQNAYSGRGLKGKT